MTNSDNPYDTCDDCPFHKQCSLLYFPPCEQLARREMNSTLESLNDLRRYANGEYNEAETSDNEREMRIHLEYENRIWSILKNNGVER